MPVTNFVWDTIGDNVLSEVDDAGVTTAKYANEPGQFGKLLSQTRGVTNSFFHFDGQGSTRQITNESQTETDSYTYSAFGEKVASSGTTTNPFQYNGAVGYYTDTETGEVYVRRRTYSPLIARWLSVDPLKFVDGPNNYSYVRNHPTGYVDPSGIDPIGLWRVDQDNNKQDEDKKKWEDALDKVDNCQDILEIIVAINDEDPKTPGLETNNPHDLLDGINSGITDKLKEFATDKHPCNRWLKQVVEILTDAEQGKNCDRCILISEGEFYIKCALPSGKLNTVVTWAHLEKNATKLTEKCNCVCTLIEQPKEKACLDEGKGGAVTID